MDKKKIMVISVSFFAIIIFDIFMCNFCVWTLEKYNELIMEMPIAPKPTYLISNLVYMIVVLCIANAMFGVFIFRSIYKMFGYSEYKRYLLGKIKYFDDDEEKKDVIERMLKNNNEIEEYFKISKKQEKFSYWVSMVCAIIGAAMLFSSIAAIFFGRGMEITVITIISGAITELVSGVVLWIHNKSAMQLNFYYNSLHENEKFLSAINMANNLKDENAKDKMYMEIIKAQIKASDEKEKNK